MWAFNEQRAYTTIRFTSGLDPTLPDQGSSAQGISVARQTLAVDGTAPALTVRRECIQRMTRFCEESRAGATSADIEDRSATLHTKA